MVRYMYVMIFSQTESVAGRMWTRSFLPMDPLPQHFNPPCCLAPVASMLMGGPHSKTFGNLSRSLL